MGDKGVEVDRAAPVSKVPLQATYRTLPWVILGILSASLFYTYFLQTAIAPILPLVQAEFDLSFSMAGILVSAYFFASAFAQIPSGILADRYSPHKIVVVALTIFLSATVLFVLIPQPLVAIAARAIMGFSSGFIFVPSIRAVVAWFEPSKVGRAVGIIGSSAFAGGSMANLIMPSMTQALEAWRPAYSILVAVGFALPLTSIIILATLRHVIQIARKSPRGSTKLSESIPTVLRNTVAWRISLMQFLYFGAFFGLLSWIPTALISRGTEHLLVSLLSAMLPFGAILGFFLSGWMADRIRKRRPVLTLNLVVFTASTAGLALLLEGSADPLLVLLPVIFLTGMSWAGNVINVIQIADIFPKDRVGTATGVMNAAAWVGSTLSPIMIGMILDSGYAFGQAFLAVAALQIITLILAVITPETARGETKSHLPHHHPQ